MPSRISLRLVLLGLALPLSAPPTLACELGNVFGSAAEQSRNASAQALDGLINIFSALRNRELRNIGAGQENLGKASAIFQAAAQSMRKVDIPASDNISLVSNINPGLLPQVQAIRESLARPSPIDWRNLRNPPVGGDLAKELAPNRPDDLKQLYRRFAAETELLGLLAANLSKRSDVPSILAQLAPAIVVYIRLGDAITRVQALTSKSPVTGCSSK